MEKHRTTASGGLGSKSVFWMILISGAAVFVLIAVLMSFSGNGGTVASDHGAVDADTEMATSGEMMDDHSDDASMPEQAAVTEDQMEADDQMGTPADQAMNDDGVTEAEDTAAVTAPEVVEDPDNGSGQDDPDGGAAAFVPTPSGPEGRDDNALTTE